MSRTSAADRHDRIVVSGARVNNLRDVSIELPKRRLTVFTGVSGSGKSSLVFDTIAAESRRLINETYRSFVQGFMPSIPRPDVDALEGLTTAIAIDQERLGGDVRSTLGTATDVHAQLRVLFSRIGRPHVGPPGAFSFNTMTLSGAGAVTFNKGGRKTRQKRSFERLGGMCPTCEGRGTVSDIDLDVIVDASKSLAEGAILVPGYSMDGWYGRIFRGSGYFDFDKPVGEFTKTERHDLLEREPTKLQIDGINLTYEGVLTRFRSSVLSRDVDSLQPHVKRFVERAVTFTTCDDCGGSRLNETARSSKIDGVDIAEVCAMQISDAARWVRTIDDASVRPLVEKLAETLDAFEAIGLGYLSLERPAGTLSGGEAQRTKLVRHLGSPLTDVTYVFDEPTAGLHPHDVARMGSLLESLRDAGNTVLVVEHDPTIIALADHVVDLGPGAGADGGTVTFSGTVAGLRRSGTPTGRHLADPVRVKDDVRVAETVLEVRGASLHNLCDLDVDVPLGVLTVITGVAGSGKSSLVTDAIAGRTGVVTVDQAPIRGSRRSSVATFTKVLDPIRKAFAKANGVKPSLFSPNSEGACAGCAGLGVVYSDLALMGDVAVPCEECDGRRFGDDVLALTFAGWSIADVLESSVDDAAAFFGGGAGDGDGAVPGAARILARLVDVGLGYVRLGQALPTLSGGERQRLRLATHLGGAADVFVLDEPTTGLHLADVGHLLDLLDRIVDDGHSVIVVEHDVAVMAHADWIIDLGPGAGHDGGRVVFEGTPADLVAAPHTVTGDHLAAATR
jgi:excinuclease UvrABC ATPase subunit